MGFFLETLIGGLMAGMLYSLIALGFVLIFKASGVFNFAQGAMVLFAALAMARFSEWIPQWLGSTAAVLGNVLGFMAAMLVMVILAWVIERLVLGKLVNQEGITLLMATLGIAYFLDGLGQTLFGSDIYKIDIGMPKDPMFLFEKVFQGGMLVNKEDVYAALIAAALVALLSLFFQKTTTGRALRAVADDHQAAQSIGIPLSPYLGHRLERGGLRGAGGRHDLGQQAGCAVLRLPRGVEGTARGHPRRADLRARRHHRRADHRRGREALRGLYRPDVRRRHRDLVCLRARAVRSACAAAGLVRRKDH